MPSSSRIVHFRANGVSVVLDCPDGGLPAVVHWGADLGACSAAELGVLAREMAPLPDNTTDQPVRLSVMPEHAAGWMGAPGLRGHRSGGRSWSPAFAGMEYEVVDGGGLQRETSAGGRLIARGSDPEAGLAVEIELELAPSGVLRGRAAVTNLHSDEYELEQLILAMPVPPVAAEVLDLAGRWAKERVPQRRALTVGIHLRESRRGRTGADAATVLTAGTSGFGFRSGDTWGLHVGFSGNHVSYLERTSSGRTVLAGGELLLPGEISLAAGERYATPWLYFAYGNGLDAQAARFHDWLRARPHHPAAPRPVTLNVWEAVYFDHRLPPLLQLAERAAQVGAERYVLDDGWFRGRRSDSAGLGDWTVDADVWPQGLHPLVARVRELGLQFGLWVEPEMVNPDSDLARAHPEWILQTGGRMPMEARRQQVLNLAVPQAYDYIFESISALVREYRLDYLKWDHNRDLVDAGSASTGAPQVHVQTEAVYRLIDALKREHPGLEIESCSSGGARVDLGILERTDRVWASDCIDPLERLGIMRWTAQLVPPELTGSHVGSPRSHTTGRTHDLSFRAVSAMFGHFGIEWNINDLPETELAELAAWVRVHKQLRPLLHSGRTVRGDHPGGDLSIAGVVSPDRTEAVYALSLLSRPVTWPPGAVRLPGLDNGIRYRLRQIGPGPLPPNAGPPWQEGNGTVLSGRILAEAGIQVPLLNPEQAVLLHLTAAGSGSSGLEIVPEINNRTQSPAVP